MAEYPEEEQQDLPEYDDEWGEDDLDFMKGMEEAEDDEEAEIHDLEPETDDEDG